MRVSRSIVISEWNDAIRRKIVDFWQERRVVFTVSEGRTLEGKRGSLLGNMTSFDMTRLITTLTVSRTSPAEIVCRLDIDTTFQSITTWNEAYWQLEMDTFESWLLYGEDKKAEWEAYYKTARAGDIRWLLSFGLFGNRTPPER